MLTIPVWIDVTEHLARREQPIIFLERALLHGNDARGGVFSTAKVARTGKYYSAASAFNVDTIRWSFVRDGEHVRVPMFSYRTQELALSSLLATGVDLGFRAALSIREQMQSAIAELYLVVGTDCHPLEDDTGFRLYVGVAVKLE